MVPRSTVRAQYPNTILPHMQSLRVDPQKGPLRSPNREAVRPQTVFFFFFFFFFFNPPPPTETTVQKKGSDTLLRNAAFDFEVRVGIDELFI